MKYKRGESKDSIISIFILNDKIESGRGEEGVNRRVKMNDLKKQLGRVEMCTEN